ncbi:toll/interleukin-1 receptor domain-containing protein [Paenibacillus anaericanus]|uniref:Toll/interleukin-1 receptor domain-containing protein n=1 Tax=Paenibacillus anaericanus TaxID=170367 RepID=A0A3S1DNA7_9BACL|nr:toll/interleukin-1 receptor domain-containing protein [Paenibacillus anaericanus]
MKEGKILKKIFISHSSKDSEYILPIIDLLEGIGVTSEEIFCTSYEPYGIPLGENFLERIKAELNENVLVLFVWSSNFFDSPVSLCELGATWVRSSKHIPILIPPFDFKDVQGVLPLSQGFKINVSEKINSFKTKILEFFGLKELDTNIWERKRNNFLAQINELLNVSEGDSNEVSSQVKEVVESLSSESDLKILKEFSDTFTCDSVYKFINTLEDRRIYSESQLKTFKKTLKRYSAPDKRFRLPLLQKAKEDFFKSINEFVSFGSGIFDYGKDEFEDNLVFYGGHYGGMQLNANYDKYERDSEKLKDLVNEIKTRWEKLFVITQSNYPNFQWN